VFAPHKRPLAELDTAWRRCARDRVELDLALRQVNIARTGDSELVRPSVGERRHCDGVLQVPAKDERAPRRFGVAFRRFGLTGPVRRSVQEISAGDRERSGPGPDECRQALRGLEGDEVVVAEQGRGVGRARTAADNEHAQLATCAGRARAWAVGRARRLHRDRRGGYRLVCLDRELERRGGGDRRSADSHDENADPDERPPRPRR
jgi:hypothetical protein